MIEERDTNLTEDKMKGENKDLQNVETDLVLPQILGSSYKMSLSQISWKHINSCDEVLKIGEIVDVKILNLSKDEKKLSLSIKAFCQLRYHLFLT